MLRPYMRSVQLVTLSLEVPEIRPEVAVMVVLPIDRPDARPDALTLAILDALENQATLDVMSEVLVVAVVLL